MVMVIPMLVNSVAAQLDIRLTSAYGNMSLLPSTSLKIHVKPDNFITTGLQIDYYISDNFGIGLGADYYIQESIFDVKLSGYSHTYKGFDNWETDPVPREYEFTIKSNSKDITEQNTMSFIDFPVSAIYTFPLFDNVYLAARLGLKAGIPLKNKYVLNESDLFTRLYFKDWNLELFNIPAHGLYDSRTDWHPEGELSLNRAYSIFSELGLDFPVSILKVRLSGYFSYGLNNINQENQISLVYWREDYNYILSLTENVKMIQAGIKLGIGIMTYKESKTKYRQKMKMCPAYQ
jgi:hypothetical protein